MTALMDSPSVSSVAPGDLREVSCCLCGCTEADVRFREEPFRVVDCKNCGLTYVTPRLDSDLVEAVYGETYWRSSEPRSIGYADYLADATLCRRTFERRWKGVRAHLPPTGRALDVGCAGGYFLDVLLAQGWEAIGLEPSAKMARHAADRLGEERVICAPLESADLPAASFDLVTLWDVLEHLPDPVAGLARARELLRPGGRIVLETQDIRAAFARLLGRRWQHYKHREHLAHFHQGTLERALGAAGLALVDLSRQGAGKYVRGDFLVERSARLHHRLPALLRPFLGGEWSVYVNLGDELIAVAEARS
jgi:2-polyprenyl-3-methyl-5-hydroxy-6-metoxy-1,4-benzoquinol methylase